MERPKYILLTVIAALLCTLSHASYRSRIYLAYNTGAMDDWEAVLIEMEKLNPKSNALILELLNYQYGYVAWCVGVENEDQAKKYIELAEENIDYLNSRNYQPAKIKAYQAAFNGFKMGLDFYRIPFLGPKSESYINLAIRLDSTEPLGYIQKANSLYYMPAAFGGSKTEAIGFYRKALGLMEDSRQAYRNDWNYLNLLVIIGIAYTELENYLQAKFFFLKALETSPELWYVKEELYPDLLKKMNEKL